MKRKAPIDLPVVLDDEHEEHETVDSNKDNPSNKKMKTSPIVGDYEQRQGPLSAVCDVNHEKYCREKRDDNEHGNHARLTCDPLGSLSPALCFTPPPPPRACTPSPPLSPRSSSPPAMLSSSWDTCQGQTDTHNTMFAASLDDSLSQRVGPPKAMASPPPPPPPPPPPLESILRPSRRQRKAAFSTTTATTTTMRKVTFANYCEQLTIPALRWSRPYPYKTTLLRQQQQQQQRQQQLKAHPLHRYRSLRTVR